ncbi:MAG: AmmeMemoRadiSam system protein A [Acidobacteria bacterium]|nr:MAG: AmmeMemoRadiSam system protein A [Acidobacteriota bacterium]
MTRLLSEEQRATLLRGARYALEDHFALAGRAEPKVGLAIEAGGVFATLRLDGELRGCIGYVRRSAELSRLIASAVVAAATGDPRFQPVQLGEVSRLRICVSVLTMPEPLDKIDRLDAIEIGRDGLIVERDGVRGLLLPEVASERNWTRDRFLGATCLKAGLPEDSWKSADTAVQRFETDRFEEVD